MLLATVLFDARGYLEVQLPLRIFGCWQGSVTLDKVHNVALDTPVILRIFFWHMPSELNSMSTGDEYFCITSPHSLSPRNTPFWHIPREYKVANKPSHSWKDGQLRRYHCLAFDAGSDSLLNSSQLDSSNLNSPGHYQQYPHLSMAGSS
jgi:hypothetical protein